MEVAIVGEGGSGVDDSLSVLVLAWEISLARAGT